MGRGAKGRSGVVEGDGGEFVGGFPSRREVTDREHDLDMSREDLRAMEPVRGLEGGAAAGPLRRGEIAYRQSQERVAGLGEVSPPDGFAIRVVRGGELTAE